MSRSRGRMVAREFGYHMGFLRSAVKTDSGLGVLSDRAVGFLNSTSPKRSLHGVHRRRRQNHGVFQEFKRPAGGLATGQALG
jgi:hypothetical protein